MNIRAVLDKMIAAHASDLHLKAGTAPVVRVDGVLYTLDEPAPSAPELRDAVDQLLNDEQRLYFSTHSEIDFAFGVSGLARFRANCFMQRGTPGDGAAARAGRGPQPRGPACCRRWCASWRSRRAGWCWSPAAPARASPRRWRP